MRIKGLVIKAYGFKRDSRARLERTAFLDFFFFFPFLLLLLLLLLLHVDSSCTTTLIVEI